MGMQTEVVLTEEAWNEISRHAEDEFPEECCGVVLSNGVTDRAQRLRNLQNELHALDPKTHPRTAAIAYNMDVRVLDSLLLEAGKIGYTLKAFYHSHPNHEPTFRPRIVMLLLLLENRLIPKRRKLSPRSTTAT